MGIKTAIHEQNAFPGVTNKILAKNVDTVFLATEKAKKYLDEKQIHSLRQSCENGNSICRQPKG